jgi:hypothetical protein
MIGYKLQQDFITGVIGRIFGICDEYLMNYKQI